MIELFIAAQKFTKISKNKCLYMKFDKINFDFFCSIKIGKKTSEQPKL